ncbi:unnamed protein product [Didymodactylos carnosus]|uniref:Uncharacterized protein n=1 Tax=Didymodactylos carnosus TaxID=1234261 RepID=A0A8S2EMX4_9BILA|nr:unnamed protein product [Didymodactylos carnosus]CAF4062587.1 unnamed protein product [Didymodactylos carnosus]
MKVAASDDLALEKSLFGARTTPLSCNTMIYNYGPPGMVHQDDNYEYSNCGGYGLTINANYHRIYDRDDIPAVQLYKVGSIAYANPNDLNGKPTGSVSADPERCCVPHQYTSQISTSTGLLLPDGKTYASYAYYNYTYDADRGMIAMKGVASVLPNQQKTNLWVIENMKTGQIYTFYEDLKRCDKAVETLRPVQCILDTATFIRSFTYGYGSKEIIGDTWLIPGDGFINYVTVSRDGLCVPLTLYVFFQKPSTPSMVNSITTTDFVPDILDPSVFDIPPECQALL